MAYVYLAIAIIFEVFATNVLKTSDGFTKPVPSIAALIGYGFAFYFLSLVLKTVPVGVAYAIWAGVGIALVTIIAAIMFKQIPDFPAILGILLIVSGVIVINVFSKMSAH